MSQGVGGAGSNLTGLRQTLHLKSADAEGCCRPRRMASFRLTCTEYEPDQTRRMSSGPGGTNESKRIERAYCCHAPGSTGANPSSMVSYTRDK
jgi:hypothetical protein